MVLVVDENKEFNVRPIKTLTSCLIGLSGVANVLMTNSLQDASNYIYAWVVHTILCTFLRQTNFRK